MVLGRLACRKSDESVVVEQLDEGSRSSRTVSMCSCGRYGLRLCGDSRAEEASKAWSVYFSFSSVTIHTPI